MPHGFDDVGPRPSLDWAAESGIVGGQTFRPSDPTTRANAAAFLYDLRPFTDVGRGNVARAAVDWARAHVIVTGYGNHTFRPAQVVTRGSAAGWVWRFLDRPPPGPVDATPARQPAEPGHRRHLALAGRRLADGAPCRSGYSDVDGGDSLRDGRRLVGGLRPVPRHRAPTFGANQAVTRGQFVRALYRLAGRPEAWAVTPPSTVRFEVPSSGVRRARPLGELRETLLLHPDRDVDHSQE